MLCFTSFHPFFLYPRVSLHIPKVLCVSSTSLQVASLTRGVQLLVTLCIIPTGYFLGLWGFGSLQRLPVGSCDPRPSVPAFLVVQKWVLKCIKVGQPGTAYTPYLQKRVSCRPSVACLQPWYVSHHHVNHQAKSSLVVTNVQDPVLPYTICIREDKWKRKPTQSFWFENSREADEKLDIQPAFAFFQVTWCLERCTTSSPSMPSTMGMGHRCTRSRDHSTGSQRLCTPSAILCTVHRWSGKTPTWSHQKSHCRPRGKSHCTLFNVLAKTFC